MKRPSKISGVLKKARECIDNGRYYDTSHAVLRKAQRQISLTHILYVLKYGYHEKQKDQYKPEHSDWNYSIRGLTVDRKDVRVIIAFDKDDMLIITVIELERGKK